MPDLMKKKLLLIWVCIGFVLPAYAVDYREQLLTDKTLLYKHWNVKENTITGYSHFRYQEEEKEGRKFIVEYNENTKANGEVFTKKTIWFDADTGSPVRYEEFDFRDNSSIYGSYAEDKISTRLIREGKTLEFSVNLTEDSVPFELVTLYLRKNLKEFLKAGDHKFFLYLPMVARDLEKNSMPLSLSLVQMKVQPGKQIEAEGISGKVQATTLLLSPTSWMIRAMIPQEKTNFRFVITTETPHHILQFEEGNTQHILTKE